MTLQIPATPSSSPTTGRACAEPRSAPAEIRFIRTQFDASFSLSPRSDLQPVCAILLRAVRYAAATLMRMVLASVFTTVLIVAMTLAAMFILVEATDYVTSVASPLQRAVAIVAELVLGVVLLLGTVWLATHLAVRIFHHEEEVDPGAPLV